MAMNGGMEFRVDERVRFYAADYPEFDELAPGTVTATIRETEVCYYRVAWDDMPDVPGAWFDGRYLVGI